LTEFFERPRLPILFVFSADSVAIPLAATRCRSIDENGSLRVQFADCSSQDESTKRVSYCQARS